MDIDELRDIIWEHLFREKATKSVAEIAALIDRDVTAVRAAVNHEWFTVAQEQV